MMTLNQMTIADAVVSHLCNEEAIRFYGDKSGRFELSEGYTMKIVNASSQKDFDVAVEYLMLAGFVEPTVIRIFDGTHAAALRFLA